jgi:polar amino acid transport system permease protein
MGTKYFEVRPLQVGDIVFMLTTTLTTIELSVIAILGGLLLGVIVGVCRSSTVRGVNILARIYVELFRGIPILLQIFMFYYGLKILGIRMPALLSASMAFVFNVAANVGETLRGIILSIPKSQWEAAACLGLPHLAQLRYVILPQVVRAAIPPSIGIMVGLIKDTSLASIIGFVELTRSGALIMAVTMNPYTAFPLIAGIYFLVCFPLTQTSRWLEKALTL